MALVWFGHLVAWTEVNDAGKPAMPKWFTIGSIVHVALQGTQAIIYILHQVCLNIFFFVNYETNALHHTHSSMALESMNQAW